MFSDGEVMSLFKKEKLKIKAIMFIMLHMGWGGG